MEQKIRPIGMDRRQYNQGILDPELHRVTGSIKELAAMTTFDKTSAYLPTMVSRLRALASILRK